MEREAPRLFTIDYRPPLSFRRTRLSDQHQDLVQAHVHEFPFPLHHLDFCTTHLLDCFRYAARLEIDWIDKQVAFSRVRVCVLAVGVTFEASRQHNNLRCQCRHWFRLFQKQDLTRPRAPDTFRDDTALVTSQLSDFGLGLKMSRSANASARKALLLSVNCLPTSGVV